MLTKRQARILIIFAHESKQLNLFHCRVCEVGLEFTAWNSILRVPRVRIRIWVRLTLTLTLNLPQSLP